MGVLSETWCFCKGVGKSEKLMAALFTGKGPAIARISAAANGVSGTGFLIHRNLLLTAHVNIPSIAAAEGCEIRLQNGVAATLVPHRFFITTSVLDLTIVGLDSVDGESNTQGQQPHYLKTCSKPNLDLGSAVYFLGHTDNEELTVAEGKVVIATDNLIKLSTDGVAWSPGSAGFDAQGNLAFMICDPMKLATSPNTKSSSTSSSSSSSWKKDSPMQFGIPVPVICDWLNQHWEGNLDELTKPKLPIIRLMSTGQKSEHSCASFSLRQVFKSTEADNDGTPSSNTVSKGRDQPNPGCSGTENAVKEGTQTTDSHGAHVQGIPTPEIYESPKLTSGPLRKKESAQIQLLDINFPPRVTKTTVQPHPDILLLPNSNEDSVKEMPSRTREDQIKDKGLAVHEWDADIASTGSVNGAQSEVQSSSSPVKVSEMYNGYSSEGETTMYSAETAESRNYTSPREGKFQQVGRSHSCVSYNRWGTAERNQVARRAMLEQQRSFIHGRKMYSQGATSQRSNDYYSPTVSSIMKKRNNSEQPTRPKQSAVHSSPRWMF
ncbi:T1B9.12 PROTEIN [Salix viminalis]|uniref:T1B9.12 PROTEIN n=1 Tax=Salix viminalis TaxID=40686 RepID=A0A6N2LDA8_SALVM|nr:T1B9.12 PROTEIN [Salix viminalis]